MKTNILMILSVIGLLFGCDQKNLENAQLQNKVDSLREELETSRLLARTLQDVGILIDSIDVNRKILRTSMVEGTTFDDFVSRMSDINRYVKQTEKKIDDLEKSAKASKSSGSSFLGTIKKLRGDLEKRNQELASLKESVAKYRNQNDNLILTVSLQKAEIEDKLSQIKIKQEETTKLEGQITKLLIQSKIDEADSYFARAQVVEETAKRTKFAPRKKRNSNMEALELYRMAALFGKDEAQVKIIELEKKI